MADTVLVTGATGFVGSHLTRRLVRDGCEVHVICREASNFQRLPDIEPQLHKHVVALSDYAALCGLLVSLQPTRIFHLAAATVVAGATGSVEELIGTNLLGTINLIEAAEGIPYRALVTTGDSFEYTASLLPLREDEASEPDSAHGISKFGATLFAQSIARTRGRPIVSLRLFSTYGPGDHPRRLLPRLIEGALDSTPILLSRPEIARDWVYIGDVIDLYLEAAERAEAVGGGVFNSGSGLSTSIAALAAAVLKIAGSASPLEWGAFPAPPHDDTPWIADMRRTFETFKWRPTTSLGAGLAATIAAFSELRPR
jgi:nucleoside-diphosphate-sugar epimerase